MAIGLEFVDVVIPIARIRESYPGGWGQCLSDYSSLLGGRVWHDEYLFREGAMSHDEAMAIVEGWSVLGFEATGRRRGEIYWKDLCVVDWYEGGPTMPCDWLSFDWANRTASLAGVEPGPLAWRRQPRPAWVPARESAADCAAEATTPRTPTDHFQLDPLRSKRLRCACPEANKGNSRNRELPMQALNLSLT